MDKMSLISILTVSVPEAILNVYIGFLLIGEKQKLLLNKNNIIRLIAAVTFMTVASTTIRANIPIGGLSTLLIVLSYIPILKFAYKIKWDKALISVILFVVVLAAIEGLYLMQCITFINKSLKVVYENDLIRFLDSLPERVMQIGIVISAWDLDVVLVNLKKYKKIRSAATLILLGLPICEMTYFYMLFDNLDHLTLLFKIVASGVSILFVTINCSIFKLITKLTKTVRLEELTNVEKQRKQDQYNWNVIHAFLTDDEIEEAKKFVKKVVNKR